MHALPLLLLGILDRAGLDSTPPLRADPVEVVAADLEQFVPSVLARDHIRGMASTAGDAVAEVALGAIGGPSYWADE